MEKGLARQRPPRCLHAKGKLKLILEEKLVTVVVCWRLGVEFFFFFLKSHGAEQSL